MRKLLYTGCLLIFWVMPFKGISQNIVDLMPKRLNSDLKKVCHFDEPLLKPLDSLNQPYGTYYKITDVGDSLKKGYAYVGRVNSCRQGGCTTIRTAYPQGNSEYFDYYVVFSNNFEVLYVNVFNYQATHGQEITAKGWLKQFIGFSEGKPLTVGKNINAISGATISVTAITNDISYRTKQIAQLAVKEVLKN